MKGKKGTININAKTYAGGVSIVAINHDTKEIFEFEDFIMVGFSAKGEYVVSNCTIPQLSEGILRLHDRLDELKAEDSITNKSKLIVLPMIDAREFER